MAPKTKYSPTLLGADGNPFKSEIITREHFTPTVTGVRSPWSEGIANGLDPSKLAALLKSANEGDNHEFLVLAEEMEERDGHYASVLGQRKRAVSGLEPIVVPASSSSDDQKIADAVEGMIMAPIFADMVDDLLDGLAKGYSAVEAVWDYSKSTWMPDRYIHRDPRHFKFDKETGQELRLRDDSNAEGLTIDPNIPFILHKPRLKSGLPVRGGFCRCGCCCSRYCQRNRRQHKWRRRRCESHCGNRHL